MAQEADFDTVHYWTHIAVMPETLADPARLIRQQELKRLASELGTSVCETVALAVRRLRQDRIGEDLTAPITQDEVSWLDADLG